MKKLPIIPIHVENFMLHIFYVLNVITKGRKLGIFLVIISFIFLVQSKDNTRQASVTKLTD